MDPPSLPPLPNAATSTPNAATIHLNYPDSAESSPRSHPADSTFNEPLPPVPGAKLRLMCSYGGHIIPRPHDKSLCYVGGETRMVAIDRRSSLSTLSASISRTLLNGRPFYLKYQLPQEDLDSLVSVTTDEDLDNMIEEYDRITASSSALSPSRVRLFIFFNKPDTAASMGSLLDDAKSETWFVDALNGSGLPRILSDSATMDCLVTLDNDHDDLEAQEENVEGESTKAKNELLHELHTALSDSPVVEKNSSFGSTSSSPSMSNLPPIRVRVEDPRVGVEEQFAQMTFAQVVQKNNDDGYGLFSAPPPPLPVSIAPVGTSLSINPAGGSSDHLNRVLSDDERSDQGVPVSFRKPPLPVLQSVQPKAGISYNLPSPDSVASDSSIASASSLSKHMYYQDQAHAARDYRAPASPDTKGEVPIPSSQIQDSGYALPPQLDQQQQTFAVPASTHFIPHPSTSTPLPMPSYYQIYAHPPSQQPPIPIDHQYPVYVMPVPQPQPYISMQTNMVDTTTVVAASRPAPPPAAYYKDSHPPIYPTKTAAATSSKPEMAQTVYRTTAVASTPTLVQVPANQFQQQYVGYPTQSTTAAHYVYSEYANATHDQMYYAPTPSTQVIAPLPPHQYQSMTPPAVVELADASKQLPTSNTVQLQNIGTSQPL